MTEFAAHAESLDAADPLAQHRSLFIDSPGVVAYLDGNSLGRPLKASAARISEFVTDAWAARLIRGWGEQWLELPTLIGDRIGRVTLGAADGQCIIGDSTTVLLYKLCRGALDMRPGRDEIVLDTDNFPTDRYVLESIAAERGMTPRWITSDPQSGVSPGQVTATVTDRTALVVLSHVAYRSGFLLDAPAIADATHDAGALLLLDLSHSVGSVPLQLDSWGIDLAVGCTYKYLSGGPGAPAFAYVRGEHQQQFDQPIHGWLGRKDAFEMGQGYVAAEGITRIVSGTPPILGMLAVQDTLDLIDAVGMTAIREKSVALTEFALAMIDETLDVTVASPRETDRRGGHITIDHPAFRDITPRLWERGVIPDFRAPQGLRLGFGPLTTSFAEVVVGIDAIRAELDAL